MDSEETLKRILELSEESNRKIRVMYRGYIWGSFWSTLKWIIIIGVSIGLFYYFQPYVNALNRAYSAISGNHSTSTPKFDLGALQRLVK